MVKCKCHRLKYLVLYYKRVVALILRIIVPLSISYCTLKFVQYDILLGTIFLNICASRSDYCLVSEDIFPLMECAKIILGYRTDHSAIVFSCSASPANQERTTGNKIPNSCNTIYCSGQYSSIFVQ
jgi:hypothetical protein